MRKFLTLTCFGLCFLFSGYAQNNAKLDTLNRFRAVIVTTYTYEPREITDTTLRNIDVDSLVTHYITHGVLVNKHILTHRILVHAFGADSRKIIFECEIDQFANIPRSDQLTIELIDKSFKNEKDKKLFWRAWYSVFDRHEDTIMTNWGKTKGMQ